MQQLDGRVHPSAIRTSYLRVPQHLLADRVTLILKGEPACLPAGQPVWKKEVALAFQASSLQCVLKAGAVRLGSISVSSLDDDGYRGRC